MKNIEIGSYVRNFGEVGKVVGFHEITKPKNILSEHLG